MARRRAVPSQGKLQSSRIGSRFGAWELAKLAGKFDDLHSSAHARAMLEHGRARNEADRSITVVAGYLRPSNSRP